MHVVYICTSVLMNYECITPILPFITIDTEMNFNFTEKTFLHHEL